jgi:hypothetical protein
MAMPKSRKKPATLHTSGNEAAAPRVRSTRIILAVGSATALVRVGIFWFLVVREFTHRSSYADIVLILFLLPEGAWVPDDMHWTAMRGLMFSVLLVLGSYLFGLVVAALQHWCSPRLR